MRTQKTVKVNNKNSIIFRFKLNFNSHRFSPFDFQLFTRTFVAKGNFHELISTEQTLKLNKFHSKAEREERLLDVKRIVYCSLSNLLLQKFLAMKNANNESTKSVRKIWVEGWTGKFITTQPFSCFKSFWRVSRYSDKNTFFRCFRGRFFFQRYQES